MSITLHRHILSICAALLFIPALSVGTPGHERLPLSPQQESALLDDLVARSPHRLALEAAKALVGDGPADTALVADPLAPPPPPPKAWPAKKGRRAYGFLPYWIGTGNVLHWDELTQIAYFSAELNSKGEFGSLHGWGGSAAKKLIAQAHQHGVQVPLTITLFSKNGIGAVLATAAKRTTLIKKITDLVISGGGDGVNIDFEGLQLADRDKMKAFIAELDNTMKKKLPGADVTLATPAVDWAGAWDYDYLAEHSDGLFVMGYGLHWKGSDPGPQLPMDVKPPWKHKTLSWVVDDYFKWGKAKNKHKFIIGLPLYGNRWPSASNKVGAKKLANGKAVTVESAWAEAPGKGGWQYDAASKSAWYVYKESGTWNQVWVETPNTFAFRTEYLKLRDVQLGLWALGYADKMNKVWASIAAYQDDGTTAGADAGDSDSGAADAGSSDAGPPDAGASDVAGADTGGSPDVGDPMDAGAAAGPADAALAADVVQSKPQDVAPAEDAGSSDQGGQPVDAAVDGARPNGTDLDASEPIMQAAPASASGCTMRSGRSAPLSLLCLGLLVLAALQRRRRLL